MPNEYIVYIRTQGTKFRSLISQFINFVDFNLPKKNAPITVLAPE